MTLPDHTTNDTTEHTSIPTQRADEPVTGESLRRLLTELVGDAFRAYTTMVQNERDDLYALTMSGLGACTRQAAYRLARTPPSEELVFTEMREANIGTMIHLGLLPRLAELSGGTEEIPVELRTRGLVIKGRSDLYIEPLATVSDLKTVGTYKFVALADTVNRAHRLQVAGYAQAVTQSGRDVQWVAWIYLDRATGQQHVVVEEFTDELIGEVDARCDELKTFADNPDAAPRDERGPGLSIICDSCPWLRECWGADAEPGVVGAQKVLIHDHDGVAAALRLYDEARAREKQAADDKDFARAMFTSFEEGNYGEWEFRFSAGRGETVDKDAAVRMLLDAGIEVPRKPVGRRLIVKRSRTED